MEHYYWSDWYSGWGWFLWFGLVLVMVSSLGNWNYTYRAHRRFEGYPDKNAIDILNERYARGEISHAEYTNMKSHISGNATSISSTNKDVRSSASFINPTF